MLALMDWILGFLERGCVMTKRLSDNLIGSVQVHVDSPL